MNKTISHIAYFVAVFVMLLMISCDKNNDKKTKISLDEYEADYGELAEKYAEMHFTTCTEAIDAGNEIVSVYYATADKAFKENDAKSKSDLEHFEELLSEYDTAIDSLQLICPEDFDKWEKENRKKIDAIMYKVGKMFDIQNGDTIWGEDVSSEIDAVNEQVEQLMINIQQLVEEEDSAKM